MDLWRIPLLTLHLCRPSSTIDSFTVHSFQAVSDSFPQKPNSALGPSKAVTDFPCRVTQQAQFENGAFLVVHAGEKLFNGFTQHSGFQRRRFAAKRFEPWSRLLPLQQRHFPFGVPALGTMIGGPFGTFAQCDQCEQTPKTVPIDDVQVSSAVADKETLVDRLDHVFRVHL